MENKCVLIPCPECSAKELKIKELTEKLLKEEAMSVQQEKIIMPGVIESLVIKTSKETIAIVPDSLKNMKDAIIFVLPEKVKELILKNQKLEEEIIRLKEGKDG